MPTVGRLLSSHSRPSRQKTHYKKKAPFNTISNYKKGSGSGLDLRLETSQNRSNMQNYSGNSNMATSPVPYIKNEPVDNDFPPRFSHNGFSDAYTMSGNGAYHPPSDFPQGFDGIDPSTLTMSPVSNDQGSMARNIPISGSGSFGYPGYNTTQNMGFMGNMGIPSDELLDLDLNKGFAHSANGNISYDMHMMSNSSNIAIGSGIDSGYSHTPDNAPIDSPYSRPYQGHQFRPVPTLSNTGIDSPSSYVSHLGRLGSSHAKPQIVNFIANGIMQGLDGHPRKSQEPPH